MRGIRPLPRFINAVWTQKQRSGIDGRAEADANTSSDIIRTSLSYKDRLRDRERELLLPIPQSATSGACLFLRRGVPSSQRFHVQLLNSRHWSDDSGRDVLTYLLACWIPSFPAAFVAGDRRDCSSDQFSRHLV